MKNLYFTNVNSIECNYLKNNIECEIVVIGAGITGLLIAFHLNKMNYNVVVLEKDRIAYQSTAITTSLLQYELDDNITKLRKYFTKDEVKEIYHECIKSINDLKEICKLINCPYTECRSLLYSNKELDKDIYEEYLFRKEINLDVKYISDINNDLKHGLLSNNAMSFNPYEFCNLLAKYLISKKVYIFENTEVLKIEDNFLTTKYNYVKFHNIVLATGYDLSLINKTLGKTYYTYNIVTSKTDVKSDLLIRDNKDPYNYYRVDDNRIIAGGYDSLKYDKVKSEEYYDNLLRDVKNIYKIKDVKIDYKYCGVFKTTNDNLGFIDKINNKYFMACYGANGILFAMIGCNIIIDDLKCYKNNMKKYFKLDR